MKRSRAGVAVAVLAALTLAGCNSARMSGINTRGPGTAIAQPLEPAPAGQVASAGQLPPPAGAAAAPADATAFPSAPTGATATAPVRTAAAPAGGPAITPGAVAGVWNATVSGQGCRVATPQTKFGAGYRAGPLRCPAPLDGVKSWNVEGSQLALYDQNGSVLARLYSSGNARFDGQTASGQPVSLSR